MRITDTIMDSLAARLMLHRTTHPTTLALAGIRAGTMAAAAIVAVDAEMVDGPNAEQPVTIIAIAIIGL